MVLDKPKIADHNIIYAKLNNKDYNINNNKSKIITFRDYNNFDEKLFQKEIAKLRSIDFTVIDCDDNNNGLVFSECVVNVINSIEDIVSIINNSSINNNSDLSCNINYNYINDNNFCDNNLDCNNIWENFDEISYNGLNKIITGLNCNKNKSYDLNTSIVKLIWACNNDPAPSYEGHRNSTFFSRHVRIIAAIAY
ncbi:Protein of unknown function [Cotesia congregata]|uniref:Uncharacterized protein n=1 Tax=Cotesia congregata TaxID=51543 RepID=A0A8J2MS75_COTCN|nr:Protein of unknown function [Cotesia congregata]